MIYFVFFLFSCIFVFFHRHHVSIQTHPNARRSFAIAAQRCTTIDYNNNKVIMQNLMGEPFSRRKIQPIMGFRHVHLFFAASMHWQRCNFTHSQMGRNGREAAEWTPLHASQWLSWLECSLRCWLKCQQNSFLSPLHMPMPSHSFPFAIIQLDVVASSPRTYIQFFGIEHTHCTYAGSISDVLSLDPDFVYFTVQQFAVPFYSLFSFFYTFGVSLSNTVELLGS